MTAPQTSSNSNKKSKQNVVGVDLGTTYSVVSYVNDSGRPETIPNAEGELLTPSVVLFEGDSTIVGKEAAKAVAVDYANVADSPKRQVGRRTYDKVFSGRRFPPEAFQGWILRKLIRDSEQTVGEIQQAVITVPAYFDEVRRKSTQDSGYIAGIDVIDIINEPTAAAIAYGMKQGFLDATGAASRRLNVLVYDLGGGTFDVTVMTIENQNFQTLSTDGDYQLGGKDWDQRIIDLVAEDFIRHHSVDPRESPETLGRLVRDAQEAKETLSTRLKTNIVCVCGDKSIKTELSREQFEELTIDLVERTAFTCRQTLKEAGLNWDNIDEILLVGGSTRMPMIREMLSEMSGKSLNTSLSPDEAVSHGAAIRAAILSASDKDQLSKAKIKNVNSHSLGVVAKDVESGEPRTVIIIPRNTPLPVAGKRTFKIHREGQESILIRIVEGENPDPEHCTPVGQYSIWDIPTNLDVGTPVNVVFTYLENGRLKLSVKIGDKHSEFKRELQRPNGLTDEQLDSWREYIQATHSS